MNIKNLSTIFSLLSLLALSFFYYSCDSDDAKSDYDYANEVAGVYKGTVKNVTPGLDTHENYIIHAKAIDKDIIELSEGVLGENFFSGNITLFLSEDYAFSHQGSMVDISGSFKDNQLIISFYTKPNRATYTFEGDKTTSYASETKLLPKRINAYENDSYFDFTYDDKNGFAIIHNANHDPAYFEYDAEGKIVRITKENDSYYPVIFEYVNDKVTIKREYPYVYDSTIVILNEKRQAVKILYYEYGDIRREYVIAYDDESRIKRIDSDEEYYGYNYYFSAFEYDKMNSIFSNVNIPDWFFLTKYWPFTLAYYAQPLIFGTINNPLSLYKNPNRSVTYSYNYNASEYPNKISCKFDYETFNYSILYQKAH